VNQITTMVSAVALLACFSCSAYVSTRTHLDKGVSPHAPTDPSTVRLLDSEPDGPYERLGEIRVETTGEPSPSATEDKLRQAAAKIGADAVIIVSRKTQEIAGPASACMAEPARRVETTRAVAIRYAG
jgi:hypothetical protein